MHVPLDASQVRFASNAVSSTVNGTTSSVTYTEAQQQEAYRNYIEQDPYLSGRALNYAERNALTLPYLHRFDFSIAQDFNVKVKGYKNTLQVRFDILNFGNLINNKWGVSQRATNNAVLQYQSLNGNGEPVFKLATQREADGTNVLIKDTYSRNSSVFDVWQAQLGIRYIF